MCGPSPPPWYCSRPSRARMCPDSILNYLHALSDLRSAALDAAAPARRCHRERQRRGRDRRINEAIGAIKHAAVDDGKNIEEHPSVDRPPDKRGRLHKALELLTKVRADVAREEADPLTRGCATAPSCTSLRPSVRPAALLAVQQGP